MPYTSNPLPLEFWTRLEVRLTAAYQVQRARLTEGMAPTLVTVDTGDAVLKQAAQARAAIFAQVTELENMQVLLMILAGQARATAFQAEIPDLESHIACLRGMAELYSTALIGLPRRLPRETEIQSALTQYNALRNAGTGEITMSERARLRAMTIELPVVGAEDAVEHERNLRALQSTIDQKDAELQNLRVSTIMSLVVPDELAGLVESFGVPMGTIAPPALPAEPVGSALALPAPSA
jgi:hypothetical protein